MHIPEEVIAMVPAHGYVSHVNHSRESIEWLLYLTFKLKLTIYHALSNRGEMEILGHFVDGFCEANKTVYLFHGCFWHGCSTCSDSDSVNPINNIPIHALYRNALELGEKIKAVGFHLIEIWEHEYLRLTKGDSDLRRFLTTVDISPRLNPRDAFFGGRTNASRLYYEGRPKYIDFTSLYPWVNKYSEYPV